MERKTKILGISTLLILAILSGIAVMAYANGLTNDTSPESNIMPDFGGCHGGGHGFGRRGFGWGPRVFINVSQEFKDNVINIAKSDPDVQKLLADGYLSLIHI